MMSVEVVEVLVVLNAAWGSSRPSASVTAWLMSPQAANVMWLFLMPPLAMWRQSPETVET
jgi:hypothetical protein